MAGGLRWLAGLWVAACLAATCAPALAESHGHPVALSLSARASLPLGDAGEYWIDETGQASIEQVSERPSSGWQATAEHQTYAVRWGQALWLRFTVEPTADPRVWYFEVPYPAVDRVSYFARGEDGRWMVVSSGDRVPVSQRAIAHRHPLLPLRLSATEPTVHLVRIENPRALGAALRFTRQDMLLASETPPLLLLGAYIGLLALGLAIAGTLAAGRRDPVLAIFCGKLLLLGLTALSITGLAGLYLWPESGTWNDLSTSVFGYAVFAVTSLMVGTAIGDVPGIHWRRRVLYGVALLGGLLMMTAGVIDPRMRLIIAGAYVAFTVLLCVLLSLEAWRRGDRLARDLALALLPLLLAAVLPVARAGGVGVANNLTQYSVLLGTVIEVPLMLLVLLRRSQARLEHTQRLAGLDRIDPATGVVTGRVFLERGQQMLARSHRFGHQALVLLVDISNAERIERDYGDHQPDELPLRVASRLMAIARDIDVVARLSHLRFGLLVEGPVSATDEASIGPRVVANCLMPFEDKPAGWVAQVRVAYALVPHDGDDMAELVRRLAELLASVPPDSRKAVFTLGNAPEAASAPA